MAEPEPSPAKVSGLHSSVRRLTSTQVCSSAKSGTQTTRVFCPAAPVTSRVSNLGGLPAKYLPN